MSENEIQNDTDESLLSDLDVIDAKRAERSSSTAAQRKSRSTYMRKYRRVKNDPQKKIEAQWSANLAALPEDERKRLHDAVEEVHFLNHLMSLVGKGVSFCGQGIGEVDKDYPNPNAVYEEILDWISKGNTFVPSPIPRSMVGLFADELDKIDDREFRDYGLTVHISPSIWQHFLSNLAKFKRRPGESTVPNTTFVQTDGLTLTQHEEIEQLKHQIRKSVGVE